MDSLSTPTTASPLLYHPRLSFDDISSTSSTTDDFFDADSCTSSASSENISSYKTEKSVISINSRTNHFAPPRHIYAGTERFRLPRGPVSLDVDGASIFEVCRTIRCWDGHIYTSAIFQTDMRDKSDEATKTTRTREGLLEAHQSSSRPIQEYESPCQGLHSSVPFSTHFLRFGSSQAP